MSPICVLTMKVNQAESLVPMHLVGAPLLVSSSIKNRVTKTSTIHDLVHRHLQALAEQLMVLTFHSFQVEVSIKQRSNPSLLHDSQNGKIPWTYWTLHFFHVQWSSEYCIIRHELHSSNCTRRYRQKD